MTDKAQAALELCRTKALAYIGTVDRTGSPRSRPCGSTCIEGKPAFNTARRPRQGAQPRAAIRGSRSRSPTPTTRTAYVEVQGTRDAHRGWRRRVHRRPRQEVPRRGLLSVPHARRAARHGADRARTSTSAGGLASQRCAVPRRRRGPAAARDVRAAARGVAPSRGHRRRLHLRLGSLLPAVRRSRRRALRVLDDARRDRAVDRARAGRRARQLQHVPQPRSARRHGADARPHLGRSRDPRHRLGLVRARLPRVRLPVRHGAVAAARLRGGARAHRRAVSPSSTRARSTARCRS